MTIISDKKADMGIGTLILFIAFILVSAVAASVIILSSVGIQSKALNTGKGTSEEVSTSMVALEIYALNASDNSVDNTVDYFYETVKVTSGSEPIEFSDILITFSTNNMSQDYTIYPVQYTGYYTNLTGSCANLQRDVTTSITRNMSACTDLFPTVVVINETFINSTGHSCGTQNQTYMNLTIASNQFGVSYVLSDASNHQAGSLTPDEIAKVCFTSPRPILEAENILIDVVPKKGSVLRTDVPMPSLMMDERIYIYP